MPDTFFTTSPEWTVYIIGYFFVGGIAGGAYFLSALLHWLGRPEDHRVVRLGYIVAAIGAVISGMLLTVDLGRPLRFWHMLFQSERFPLPILKAWSPMSIGAWALFFFGGFATLSALGALAYEGRIRYSQLRIFYEGILGRLIAVVGAVFGFFIAGYTGVLLSVTNRPIWANTQFLGVLFLISGASTAAATLILLARHYAGAGDVVSLGRSPGARNGTVEWLAWFDGWALLLELAVLIAFLVSLGEVARVWLSWWGLTLLLLVVFVGIVAPLALHFRPTWVRESWRANRLVTGAVLVLIGGFFLRLVVLLASDTIHVRHAGLF